MNELVNVEMKQSWNPNDRLGLCNIWGTLSYRQRESLHRPDPMQTMQTYRTVREFDYVRQVDRIFRKIALTVHFKILLGFNDKPNTF